MAGFDIVNNLFSGLPVLGAGKHDEWANLTNGSFKGVPFHAAIPSRDRQYGIESEEMTIERRLQFIKRPLVDGAPVRDWGADPEVYVAVIEFFGVNHAKTAEAFLQTLNEGTPGQLILPTQAKAVLAYFWKRTRATHHNDGNSIKVTVTWVAATEVDALGTGKASGSTLTPPSIDQAKSSLDADVSNALGILQDNPFLTAVRTFEGGLSKVRSVVNGVLTLEEGVRNRIAAVEANIKATLALVKSATDQIHALFSPSASAAAKTTSSSTSLGTDKETGQTVIDVSEPDTLPPAADPLAAPEVAATIDVGTSNLGSGSGVIAFGDAIADSLSADRDEVTSSSAGRTEDVARALTTVLNSLAAYIQSVSPTAPLTYTIPYDMSLGEAMFLNGIDLSQMRTIHKANSHVLDPFVVPKGTVLVL